MNFRLNIFLIGIFAFMTFASAQPILKIDFNDRSGNPATNTLAGFASFLINSNISSSVAQTNPTSRTFGAITVTLSGSGLNPGYDDKQRPEPTNSGSFTEGLLLRDFIESNSRVDNGGLVVSISGLASNLLYAITIWSFDRVKGGQRVSDWFANGQLLVDNYTFDGRVLPVSNDSYRFTFYARSDATGRLLIEGKRDSSSVNTAGFADIGVILNALQLEAVLRISSYQFRTGSLIMKVDSPQASQTHHVEQTASLRNPAWSEVTTATFSAPSNNSLTVTIPGPLPGPRCYRVRY